MSFLDNLENSLNSLEKGSEREEGGREQARRKLELANQAAIAPWAERLKKSAYTEELLKTATREGFKLRTKVYISWSEAGLRLEARERRMLVQPTASGIEALFFWNNEQCGARAVGLESDPADLVRDWLAASAS